MAVAGAAKTVMWASRGRLRGVALGLAAAAAVLPAGARRAALGRLSLAVGIGAAAHVQQRDVEALGLHALQE